VSHEVSQETAEGRRTTAVDIADDAPSNADEDDWSWTKLVLGRYRMRGVDVVGVGNFSVVRRATDEQTGKDVAVKQYKKRAGSSADGGTKQGHIRSNSDRQGERAEHRHEGLSVFEKFEREIELFRRVYADIDDGDGGDGGDGGDDASYFIPESIKSSSGASSHSATGSMGGAPGAGPACPARDLFVELLDFSKDPLTGRAAVSDDGCCYTVLELASGSLDDAILNQRDLVDAQQARAAANHTNGSTTTKETETETEHANSGFRPAAIQKLAHSILSALSHLHARGLVHADLKPENGKRGQRDANHSKAPTVDDVSTIGLCLRSSSHASYHCVYHPELL
jgi:serine/threonine protein kinase